MAGNMKPAEWEDVWIQIRWEWNHDLGIIMTDLITYNLWWKKRKPLILQRGKNLVTVGLHSQNYKLIRFYVCGCVWRSSQVQWNFPDPCISIGGITPQDTWCFIAGLAHTYTHTPTCVKVRENYFSACSLWSEACSWVTDVLPYVILIWHILYITLIQSSMKRRTCCQFTCFKHFLIRSFPFSLCFRLCRNKKKNHHLYMQLFTEYRDF